MIDKICVLVYILTKKMVAECYENSFSRFVAAFIGDGKLSEEEADELRKLL